MSEEKKTQTPRHLLGIDIGSTTVKIAILDHDSHLLFSDYKRHFADIQRTLRQNFKILGRQCQSHTEHDNSDNQRLAGKFIAHHICKQLEVDPAHQPRKEKGDNRYGNHHGRSVIG